MKKILVIENQTQTRNLYLDCLKAQGFCTMSAENITPGNYSFQVGVYAQSAPYSWRTAYIIVEAPMKPIEGPSNQIKNSKKSLSANESVIPRGSGVRTKAETEGSKRIPGSEFVLALATLMIATKRARR